MLDRNPFILASSTLSKTFRSRLVEYSEMSFSPEARHSPTEASRLQVAAASPDRVPLWTSRYLKGRGKCGESEMYNLELRPILVIAVVRKAWGGSNGQPFLPRIWLKDESLTGNLRKPSSYLIFSFSMLQLICRVNCTLLFHCLINVEQTMLINVLLRGLNDRFPRNNS